jgi:REP element-mobilizing transposase RayT
MLPEDPGRQLAEQRVMNAERYYLSGDRRAAVLEALRDVCLHRGWNLLAAHIRTTHLHVIVESNTCPEKVMNAFKSYASRRLNLLEQERPDRKRWTRHGSTRWLWKDLDMREAVRYVVEEQGRPMAVFVSDEL